MICRNRFFWICLSGSLPTQSLFLHAQEDRDTYRLRIRDFMVASEIGSEMNHNLDNDTQGEITSDGDSKALPASQLQAHEHPALPGTYEVIRRLNRDTTLVATGLLGAVIFAALLLALLEYHPKADDLTKEARQTTGSVSLNANPSALGNVTKSTNEITSRQATSVDHEFAPEIKHPDLQANATSWSPANRPNSARVIRPKIPDVKHGSSVRLRYVNVKTRLIALWHQSLRGEKSRRWTLFSNSKKWQRKKISYTAATSH